MHRGLTTEATTLQHSSGNEMVIVDRDYPCKIIGEKQMRGQIWYVIKWEPTIEPAENVGWAAIKDWQEKKKHEGQPRARYANARR
jgi:hypothetical protein